MVAGEEKKAVVICIAGSPVLQICDWYMLAGLGLWPGIIFIVDAVVLESYYIMCSHMLTWKTLQKEQTETTGFYHKLQQTFGLPLSMSFMV